MPSKFVRLHWSNLSRDMLGVCQMVIALPILILVLVGSLGLLATVLLVKMCEWALYGVFSRLSKH